MTTFVSALRSSLGKKYLMALTGLVWVGFAIGHVIGNYLLFAGREAFNGYAHFLEGLGHGAGIYLAEAALLVVLLIHIWNGLQVALFDKMAARPTGYLVQRNAGGRSRKGLASQSMIWTGLFLLAFLILHILTFKFGLGAPHTTYTFPGTEIQTRDLYQIVVWRFSNPIYVGFYTVAMLLFGMHLKHGVWSALQSLGLLNKKTLPAAVTAATILAVVLAIGFLMLPITIYTMNSTFATPHGGLFQ